MAKILFTVIAAVCALAGSNALGPFSGLVGPATDAANQAVNIAGIIDPVSDAVNDIVDSVTDAVDDIVDSVTDAVNQTVTDVTGAVAFIDDMPGLESLSDAAKTLLSSALSGVDNETVDGMVDKMDGVDLIDTIKGAQVVVGNLSRIIQPILENTVSSVIDVNTCFASKLREVQDLAQNIANVPVRAATLVQDGLRGYLECNAQITNFARRTCQVTTIAPVAVRSALLVKDTVKYTAQTATLVTTLRSQLTQCATKAAASNIIELGKQIASALPFLSKNQ